ncbi:MAG TPA: hypothetical protein VGH16_03505 [Candidatus Binatia bacterium]
MKKALLAIGTAALLFVLSPAAHAQVPYYGYDPYAAYAQPDYPQAYDPYYQLHVLHYQLYLQPYGYYYYTPPPVFVPGAPVVVAPSIAAPAGAGSRVVSRPVPPLRSAIPVVKRR